MPDADANSTAEAKVGSQLRLGRLAFLIMAIAVVLACAVRTYAKDRLEPDRAVLDAYISEFRVSGTRDPAALAKLQRDLHSLVGATSGEEQAQALLELGRVQRITNQFTEAVATLTSAAELAARVGRSDVAFDAWMQIARAHIIGTHDHGAAQAAMDRALTAAGASPSPKQRYDIAITDSDGSAARGELGAALVSALDAVRLASVPADRFYGEQDTGSALEYMVESCDYQQLRDRHSDENPAEDGWGACRRAVTAAEAAYGRALRTAEGLGWKFLASQARESIQELEVRRGLIEQRAHSLPASPIANFAPRNVKDVLVERGDFARRYLSAAFSPTGPPALLSLAQQTLAYAASAPGAKDNPQILSLQGSIEERKGGKPEAAAELYAQAAKLLATQRASFFDARRRGTVIEGYSGLFPELAQRLLALRRDADAFAVFESARARGLGEMAQALGQKDVTAGDRAALAELLRLEAETSAIETRIAENVIADGKPEAPPDDLSLWEKSQSERRAYLQGHEEIRDRFARKSFTPSGLTDLQEASSRAGIPVLPYWVASPNVIVWYVGPHGSDVRIVFLPEAALTGKIAKLMTAVALPFQSFDQLSARELYLYLVAPFEIPWGDGGDRRFGSMRSLTTHSGGDHARRS